jgi:hypothetical protein
MKRGGIFGLLIKLDFNLRLDYDVLIGLEGPLGSCNRGFLKGREARFVCPSSSMNTSFYVFLAGEYYV